MKSIDYKQKSQEIVNWIKKTFQEAGFSRAVVAVSGGVDSAVSLYLAVRALGKENTYALLLPYGKLSKTALEHGKLVAKSAGLTEDHVMVIDIKKAVDVILSETKDLNLEITRDSSALPQNDIRRGNIMARVRMMYLFDVAKKLNTLVVGTENKSEYYLGYFTRFGDEASDVEPIVSLYKTQVFEMATYLGVPKEIIEKTPSANLWEGQTDAGEFGFSYTEADEVLFHYFEEKLPREAIIDLGIPAQTVDSVLAFVARNDFKHKVPYIKA